MRIFDRWGKLIFESSEPSYKWDGVLNGSPAQQGKYVYQFNIQDDNRNYHQFVGEIMLMR
jgi:gliding motility-associated-like protein